MKRVKPKPVSYRVGDAIATGLGILRVKSSFNRGGLIVANSQTMSTFVRLDEQKCESGWRCFAVLARGERYEC